MKFKNLLVAGEEYTELFGVGVDPGEDISLVAQSEFFSTLHPKKKDYLKFLHKFFLG